MDNLKPKEYANLIFKEVQDRSMQSDCYNKDVCIFLVNEFIKWVKPSNEDLGFSLEPSYNYWIEIKQELEKIEI